MKVFLIAVTLFLSGCNTLAGSKQFKLSVMIKATDDAGMSVSNALVGIGFEQNHMLDPGINKRGFTGTDGVFKAYALTTGGMGLSVKKEGYYPYSLDESFFKNSREIFIRPYDPFEKPIEVLMRSKLNPIPMYVKKIELAFPVEGEGIGFDLKKSDWVSPHGSGKFSDFIFLFSRNFHDDVPNYDAELKISFPNPRDGIQLYLDQPRHGSKLRLPHHAPKSGYKTTVVKQMSFKKDKGYKGFEDPDDSQKNYIFRIRSEENEEGNLVKANYGKIHGPFLLSHTKRRDLKAKITFTYYFNPTVNDHNLEFNPDKNLFGGSKKFAP